MHRTLLTAAAALVGMNLIATVQAGETVVKLEGCEFSVTLPDEPAFRTGRPAAPGTPAAAPSRVALLRGKIPAYRVECQALSSIPPEAESALFDNMLDTAESMSVEDVLTERGRSRDGLWARFTGNQTQARNKLVVTGTFYLGERSIMSVIATEGARNYPSDAVTRVFKSVRR